MRGFLLHSVTVSSPLLSSQTACQLTVPSPSLSFSPSLSLSLHGAVNTSTAAPVDSTRVVCWMLVDPETHRDFLSLSLSLKSNEMSRFEPLAGELTPGGFDL